jgi:hypothetical protein
MESAQKSIVNRGEGRVSKAVEVENYIKTLEPSNTPITPEVLRMADEVLKTPNKIFCRYIRSPKMGIMVEHTEDNEGDETTIYSVVFGRPIALMVAFVFDDKLYIGWAKRNSKKPAMQELYTTLPDLVLRIKGCDDNKKAEDMLRTNFDLMMKYRSSNEEEMSFHKKAAKRVAVIRALSDEIIRKTTSSIHETKSGVMIPRVISKYLDEFIDDCYRVFNDRVPENFIIEVS